jgi:hypothetical protein
MGGFQPHVGTALSLSRYRSGTKWSWHSPAEPWDLQPASSNTGDPYHFATLPKSCFGCARPCYVVVHGDSLPGTVPTLEGGEASGDWNCLCPCEYNPFEPFLSLNFLSMDSSSELERPRKLYRRSADHGRLRACSTASSSERMPTKTLGCTLDLSPLKTSTTYHTGSC